jgi:hypothetical protein
MYRQKVVWAGRLSKKSFSSMKNALHFNEEMRGEIRGWVR